MDPKEGEYRSTKSGDVDTLPETNICSPLKHGGFPPGSLEITIGNHPFLGPFAVSFRDGNSPTWIT